MKSEIASNGVSYLAAKFGNDSATSTVFEKIIFFL
jgi:hypothetical protein